MTHMFKNLLGDNSPGTTADGAQPPAHPLVVPFISPTLLIKELPDDSGGDIEIDSVIYRRLTPKYFCWLRAKIFGAQQARKQNRISSDTWNELVARFNTVQKLAVSLFGEAELQTLWRTFSPAAYRGPAITSPPAPPQSATSKFLFPQGDRPDLPNIYEVSPEALAAVDKIKLIALNHGWTREQLYRNRGGLTFPYAEQYGLGCFINPGIRIGNISREYIELIHPSGSHLRFYNPDVAQPWIRKAEKNAS